MPLNIPCPRCGAVPPPPCGCPPLPPGPPDSVPRRRAEIVKLRREKRGGGREIIVLEGFPADVDLEELASDLKKRCGTGGTVKGRTLEIQGDHRDLLAQLLLERGFRSKRAGG